jgi:hypothetical protein
MIYGIQARQSVRLTEVSRSLSELIPIKKTEERLSRQLGNPELSSWLTKRLLTVAADRIRETTLLIVDLSDIHKKYARKMEHLAWVWDGSEGEKNIGYWTLNIVGAEIGSAQIIPLYGKLFSQKAPDFESENWELRAAIGQVLEKTKKRGILVIDRGGDRGYLFQYLLHEDYPFIIRLRGDRTVFTDQKESALEAAVSCPMMFNETIVREEGRREKRVRLQIGCRRVRLPGHREDLMMVVVKGFGPEPMILLTNLPVRRSRKSIWHIVAAYMTRWRIEETIRFMKQSYQVEDVRVLKYVRLQNMMVILMAVIYFASAYLGTRLKLRVLSKHLVRAARRVFGVPDFRFYALADGIKQVLFNRLRGPGTSPRPSSPTFFQRLLFDS